MKPILEIQNISKKFTINSSSQQPYLSLRDSLVNFIKSPLKVNSTSEFWALNKVNFNVMPGDTIGIIGKNGAGKSTLLKILSKITPPTSGKIICRGRIASLLEVGTGFHPELSGRENVFMNGSILGMRQTEIKKNFDAIVDFAGVEKFIDTPLKHYSSGMQLRLAFAVAAFLENEILIIDEVLAVGDAEFQKKCLGKMEDVSKDGRTVLFVSHNMSTLQSLVKNAVFIKQGVASNVIDIQSAVKQYLYGDEYLRNAHEFYKKNHFTTKAEITEAKVLNSKFEISERIETCEDFYVEMYWKTDHDIAIMPSIEMDNFNGIQILFAAETQNKKNSNKGSYSTRVKIPANLLNASEFFFRLALYDAKTVQLYDLKANTLNITVYDPMDERCIARGNITASFEKYILLPALNWETHQIDQH